MSTMSKTSKPSSIQDSDKSILSFLKILFFYALSFTFWVGLFINNEGSGGVEYQHLVLMAIVHSVLIFIHALAVFKPKQNNK